MATGLLIGILIGILIGMLILGQDGSGKSGVDVPVICSCWW